MSVCDCEPGCAAPLDVEGSSRFPFSHPSSFVSGFFLGCILGLHQQDGFPSRLLGQPGDQFPTLCFWAPCHSRQSTMWLPSLRLPCCDVRSMFPGLVLVTTESKVFALPGNSGPKRSTAEQNGFRSFAHARTHKKKHAHTHAHTNGTNARPEQQQAQNYL